MFGRPVHINRGKQVLSKVKNIPNSWLRVMAAATCIALQENDLGMTSGLENSLSLDSSFSKDFDISKCGFTDFHSVKGEEPQF